MKVAHPLTGCGTRTEIGENYIQGPFHASQKMTQVEKSDVCSSWERLQDVAQICEKVSILGGFVSFKVLIFLNKTGFDIKI